MDLTKEDIVLKYLLQDKNLFNKAYPYLSKMSNHKGKKEDMNFFENEENKKIFSKIKENFEEFSQKPNYDDIVMDISLSNEDSNVKENIKTKINTMKSQELTLSKHKSENLLMEWIKNRRVMNVMLRHVKKVDGVTDDNIASYMNIATNVKFARLNSLRPLTIEGIQQVLEYCSSERNYFSSGLTTIDDLMGGYGKGIVIGIGAFLHVGKTAFMSFVARNALKQGRNVLFLNGESIDKQVSPRIIASLLGYDIADFNEKDNIEKIIASLNELLKKDGYGQFVIHDFPAGGYTTQDLEELLHELRNEEVSFVPDIICLDYIQLWNTTLPYKNNYEKYGFATTELSNLARMEEDSKGEQGITIFLGMQLNKTAHEAVTMDKETGEWESEVGNHMIQDSVIIPQKCDVVLFMANNKELMKANQTFFYIGKNRQNGVLSSFLLGNNFNRMEYYDIDDVNQNLNNMLNNDKDLKKMAVDMVELSKEIDKPTEELDRRFNEAVRESVNISIEDTDEIPF